jgi:hypothetical protein
MTQIPVQIVLHQALGLCVVLGCKMNGADGPVILIKPLEPPADESPDVVKLPAWRCRSVPRPETRIVELARQTLTTLIKNDAIAVDDLTISFDTGDRKAVAWVTRRPNGVQEHKKK